MTVPSMGSMIQVGAAVSSTRSPAATDSSPMNLLTRASTHTHTQTHRINNSKGFSFEARVPCGYSPTSCFLCKMADRSRGLGEGACRNFLLKSCRSKSLFPSTPLHRHTMTCYQLIYTDLYTVLVFPFSLSITFTQSEYHLHTI